MSPLGDLNSSAPKRVIMWRCSCDGNDWLARWRSARAESGLSRVVMRKLAYLAQKTGVIEMSRTLRMRS